MAPRLSMLRVCYCERVACQQTRHTRYALMLTKSCRFGEVAFNRHADLMLHHCTVRNGGATPRDASLRGGFVCGRWLVFVQIALHSRTLRYFEGHDGQKPVMYSFVALTPRQICKIWWTCKREARYQRGCGPPSRVLPQITSMKPPGMPPLTGTRSGITILAVLLLPQP